MTVLSQNLTINNMVWEFVSQPTANLLMLELLETNSYSETTEMLYVAGMTNTTILKNILDEWSIMELLIDQQLVQDFENDYFIELCSEQDEECACESGLVAFSPIDESDENFEMESWISYRYLP